MTDDSFPIDVEAREGLPMVDFWATCCGPCPLMAPVLERGGVRGWFRDADLVDATLDCVGADCCASSRGGDAAAFSTFIASGTKPRVGGWP